MSESNRIRLEQTGNFNDICDVKVLSLGNVMNAFRLAVVGECKGPHMFDITALLGKEETLARIQRAIDVLK